MEYLDMELIQAGEKELVELKNFRESIEFNELKDFKKNKIENNKINMNTQQ